MSSTFHYVLNIVDVLLFCLRLHDISVIAVELIR